MTRRRTRVLAGTSMAAALVLAGCAPSEEDGPTDIATAIEEDVTISFWHVYQGADQEAIDALVASFEDEHPQVSVEVQYTGGFGEQNQKIISSLQAGDPPNVAIAFPAQVLDYETSGLVLDLTSYIESPEVGLGEDELADIFEIERTINRYDVADGNYLSFPFTANVMVMYYNEDLLGSVGIDDPPATWDDFAEQCAIIKDELDLPCFSARGDGSSMNGVAGAFGGLIRDETGAPAVDSAEWLEALQMFEDLAASGYVEVAGGGTAQVTGPDLQSFISERAAFVLGTSRNIGFFPDAIGDAFSWQAAPPPQAAATDAPVTVLYGPGVTAFDSDTAQEDLASWLFMEHLASAESQEAWALSTGQLPIRESVANSEAFQAELTDDPATAVAYGLVPDTVWDGALGPNGVIAGISQQERELLASVMNAVLLGDMDAETAQQQLITGVS
ncbi:extracellular solute-binding protein [Ruania alba]|uniref:ABC-type glycerol-3-phosphate transport system, substrate-binding protein n=1 Tax=Ruania alba TaxID=648782 RepID=A0A1H5CPX6_9MICO|nr:extracellular solute-binding protein [Ruania alba]SED68752.1 ABC-type glycerol-3-phosphate transport system, substrate-binding protein [Ruania alba]